MAPVSPADFIYISAGRKVPITNRMRLHRWISKFTFLFEGLEWTFDRKYLLLYHLAISESRINYFPFDFQNDLDDPERGMIFVCSAAHRTKTMFFFLVQTEQGDVFKITMEMDEEVVKELKLKYFDTVPVATSMCVLKTGFLFVASEFGNQ